MCSFNGSFKRGYFFEAKDFNIMSALLLYTYNKHTFALILLFNVKTIKIIYSYLNG